MTASAVDELGLVWAEELSRAVKRYRLVLTTMGLVHEPWRRHLVSVSEHLMSVADYLQKPAAVAVPRVIVLLDLEETRAHEGQQETLSVLREHIVRDMDAGVNFLLVSRFARIRYAEVPGSSLLEDAKLCLPPILSVSEPGADPAMVLPIYAHGGLSDLSKIFYSVLDELGVEVLATLDHALFEAVESREQVLSLLTAREIEALVGTGMAVFNGDAGYAPTWSMPARYGEFREALCEALARLGAGQSDLSETFEHMWCLERSIRSAVRSQSISIWGSNWRAKVLYGDLPQRVLERARGEAYLGARSIKEVRDPLEWLSLGELLELRERGDIGNLGVEVVVWKRLALEILPIRNRITHMRLLRAEDLDKTRQWRRVLSRNLQPE